MLGHLILCAFFNEFCQNVQDFILLCRIIAHIRAIGTYVKEGDLLTTDMSVMQLLQNALSATQLRQQAYANNIANVETPGYKRQDVDFESLLNSAMSSGPPTGQASVQVGSNTFLNLQTASQINPVVVQDTQSAVQNNGNNVDIDAEMSKLAANQIRYNALIEDMQSRFARLKTAIDN